MIPIFDHHIHMDVRNGSDYELMALAGIRRVLVPCTNTHEKKYRGESYGAHFDRITEFERARAAHFGIELYAGLAIHAADLGDFRSARAGIDEIEKRLDHPCVRAIGEITLQSFTREEIDVFVQQLRLAAEHGCPVMVEAPPDMAAFQRLLSVLSDAIARGAANPAGVCIMDLNHAKLKRARELCLGGYGLPVSPALDALFCLREKLGHVRILEILGDFGPERLMLNSGLHVGNADPLCLAKTVLRLELHGVDPVTLTNLANDHAAKLFRTVSL